MGPCQESATQETDNERMEMQSYSPLIGNGGDDGDYSDADNDGGVNHGNGAGHVALDQAATESSSSNNGADGMVHQTNRGSQQKSVRNGCIQLLFGQLIALLAASQNMASFFMENRIGILVPMFMLLNCYILLSVHLLFRPKGCLNYSTSSSNTGGQHASTSIPQTSSSSSDNADDIDHSDGDIDDMDDDDNNDIDGSENFHRLPLTTMRLRAPYWNYCILSALDIIPNYMVLMSLKYTSLTSATLLGSLTIPSTMLMCRLILKKGFGWKHVVGAILCLMGGICNVLSDVGSISIDSHSNDDDDDRSMNVTMDAMKTAAAATTQIEVNPNKHPFWGDMLAVAAAVTYGLSDALAEYFVKNVDRTEYLGMLGLNGAIAMCIMIPLMERDAVMAMIFDGCKSKSKCQSIVGVAAWYVGSLVLYYISSSIFLVQSDATLMNLSSQAANLWAAVFSVAILHQAPSLAFYVAIVFVGCGVVLYEFGHAKEAVQQQQQQQHNHDSEDHDERQRDCLMRLTSRVNHSYDSI